MALPSFGDLFYLPQPQRKRRDSIVDDMDLTNLLNTNRAATVAGFRNMSYEVQIPLSMSHDMSGNPHYAHGLYVPNGHSRIKSETGSESPHPSDHSSRYSSQTPQQSLGYQQMASQLTNEMRYPSPSQLPQPPMPMVQHTYHPNATSDPSFAQSTQLGTLQQAVPPDPGSMENTAPKASSLPKAFACSTCSKGFARRSDLARHERIHSGVRPHVCDHPGCGKQFIQRSALTVHSRVHTGEKPHMCERCGKPFSDSSSLARHRRIHSGKRPYKCPYADCQKTFTRRTTLTRHQNHHTGTIEESAAATAAALASKQISLQNQRSRGSDDENDVSVDGKSPMAQLPDRQSSATPSNSINGMPQLQRQASEYYMQAAMSSGMAAVPQHLRGEMQPSPRAQSPAQYSMPVNGQPQQRQALTSNPASAYNPPQILEPPTLNGQSQGGSGSNSPHMSASMGWHSPHSSINGAPQNDYPYADPSAGYSNVGATPMYYQQQGVQRPHSTGPIEFSSLRGQEMWAQHQQ